MSQKIPESLLQKYKNQALEYAARALPAEESDTSDLSVSTEGKAVAAVSKAVEEENIKEAQNTETDEKLPQGETVEPEENPQSTADSYIEFLKIHPAVGGLKIQITTANGTFPVKGATVEVAVELNGKDKIIFNNTTDNSGIVDNMPLPALPSDYSQTAATAAGSGTEYKVSIFSPGFLQLKDIGVSIFDSIKTILPVELEPIAPLDSEEGN